MPVDTNSMRDLVNSNNPVRPDGWSRSTLPNSFATIVAPSIPRQKILITFSLSVTLIAHGV